MQLWQPESKTLWRYSDYDRLNCREAFLKEPLYEGKTFWEVEPEIEWLDE